MTLPASADRTHCPHGHPYEGDNVILMVVRENGVDTGKRKRQCRACKRMSHKGRKVNTSDIPEADEKFFEAATLRSPG